MFMKWLKNLVKPQPFMPFEPVMQMAGSPAASRIAPAEAAAPADIKPSLKQRILEGLPGFVGSAGSVMAAKAAAASCAKGLCIGASPLALGAAGVLGAAAVGGVTAQTVTYVRDRWAQAEAARGGKIRARDLVKEFSVAAAKREANAFYENGLKSKDFWKGAATKGGISALCGAAFGGAMSTETVQNGLHKAGDYLSQIKPLNVLDKVVTFLSGSGTAEAAQAFKGAAQDGTAAVGQALAPSVLGAPAALDQLKALVESKGTPNTALSKLMGRAFGGNMQALKDLAMGAWNGKLGVPMNKELARELYKAAAAGGNAQAVRDLAWIDSLKGSGVSAPVAAPAALPVAAAAPTVVLDVAAPQPAALSTTDNLTPAGSIDEMAPVILPLAAAQPQNPPARLGEEAARCVSTIKDTGVARHVESICSVWKTLMQKGDAFLVGSPDGKTLPPYIYEGDTPVQSTEFMNDSLANFASQPR